jgi:hypothetical protein
MGSTTDCTDPVYDSCQMINHVYICTKACPNGNGDCPDPPTSGMCNGMGYCK